MTDLHRDSAAHFVRSESFISAERTTKDSGLRALLPDADMDDYVFEPCGYSMNGVQDAGGCAEGESPCVGQGCRT